MNPAAIDTGRGIGSHIPIRIAINAATAYSLLSPDLRGIKVPLAS